MDVNEHKYIIVNANSIEDLETLVNIWMNQGFNPFGSMVIRQDRLTFYQTMMKCQEK
jgi:hypothetical protein